MDTQRKREREKGEKREKRKTQTHDDPGNQRKRCRGSEKKARRKEVEMGPEMEGNGKRPGEKKKEDACRLAGEGGGGRTAPVRKLVEKLPEALPPSNPFKGKREARARRGKRPMSSARVPPESPPESPESFEPSSLFSALSGLRSPFSSLSALAPPESQNPPGRILLAPSPPWPFPSYRYPPAPSAPLPLLHLPPCVTPLARLPHPSPGTFIGPSPPPPPRSARSTRGARWAARATSSTPAAPMVQTRGVRTRSAPRTYEPPAAPRSAETTEPARRRPAPPQDGAARAPGPHSQRCRIPRPAAPQRRPCKPRQVDQGALPTTANADHSVRTSSSFPSDRLGSALDSEFVSESTLSSRINAPSPGSIGGHAPSSRRPGRPKDAFWLGTWAPRESGSRRIAARAPALGAGERRAPRPPRFSSVPSSPAPSPCRPPAPLPLGRAPAPRRAAAATPQHDSAARLGDRRASRTLEALLSRRPSRSARPLLQDRPADAAASEASAPRSGVRPRSAMAMLAGAPPRGARLAARRDRTIGAARRQRSHRITTCFSSPAQEAA